MWHKGVARGAQLGVSPSRRSVVLHRLGGGTVRTWYAVPGFLQRCACHPPLGVRGVAGRLVPAPAVSDRVLTLARSMGHVGGRAITLGLRRTWAMSPLAFVWWDLPDPLGGFLGRDDGVHPGVWTGLARGLPGRMCRGKRTSRGKLMFLYIKSIIRANPGELLLGASARASRRLTPHRPSLSLHVPAGAVFYRLFLVSLISRGPDTILRKELESIIVLP